jgi:hypothetical protein
VRLEIRRRAERVLLYKKLVKSKTRSVGYSVPGLECRCSGTGNSLYKTLVPSFRQLVHSEVTVKTPVLLLISRSAQNSCHSASWFASNDDYLTILVRAWAFVLSARWVEVMPASCSLTYTKSRARHEDATTKRRNGQHSLVVDIGPAGPEQARWWTAVLARGQGWQAIPSRLRQSVK